MALVFAIMHLCNFFFLLCIVSVHFFFIFFLGGGGGVGIFLYIVFFNLVSIN